jgi:hypothetical protein
VLPGQALQLLAPVICELEVQAALVKGIAHPAEQSRGLCTLSQLDGGCEARVVGGLLTPTQELA